MGIRTQRFRWTLYAPVYDALAHFGRLRRRSVQLLRAKPGERVLIVGCGPGADIDYLPAGVRVAAIDVTPAMARRTAARAPHAAVCVMDGSRLGFRDASFDAVLLHLILAVMPEPAACLREVDRVLKPGGRATVLDKFVPDAGRPSLGRRLFNPLTAFFGTVITRRLGDLRSGTALVEVHREPALLGGALVIAVLEKR